VSDRHLKGKVLGFEEYEHYTLEAAFGESSPFRLLVCSDAPISFAVVNPYHIVADYSFEIEDNLLKGLFADGDYLEDMAVLCVVRPEGDTLYVNLRSPLIINTKTGVFLQTILQSEAYGVSVPVTAQKAV